MKTFAKHFMCLFLIYNVLFLPTFAGCSEVGQKKKQAQDEL